MAISKTHWWLLAVATEWVAADLAGQMPSGMRVPNPDKTPPPTTLKALDDYIPLKVVGHLDLLESVKIADNAFNNAVAALAAQHLAAAAVIVERPSDEILKTVRKDLATVSEQLKDVQRFRAAATLAGALAGVIKKNV